MKPQRIIVNIDLSVKEGDDPNDDDIGHVVSYEIVVKKVEPSWPRAMSAWSRRCAEDRRRLPQGQARHGGAGAGREARHHPNARSVGVEIERGR